MFFLNLALGQLLLLAGVASAVTVALYLFDRSRRRLVVSTLRFWTQAAQPVSAKRRKQIQQPFSLLLQLAAMLLLLLALAQPRFGNPFIKPRFDVLILDTSSWMAARNPNAGTLMDITRRRANDWLRRLPATDRVMLIRADALATPATAFEADREKIRAAIAQSEPGATALNLDDAIALARRAQALQSAVGEIAYVGGGRIRDAHAEPAASANRDGDLRVISIPDEIENAGLERVSAKPSGDAKDGWDVLAAVRNYGGKPRSVTVTLGFNHAPAGAQRFVLPAGAERDVAFLLRTNQPGLLEARVRPGDAFAADDAAQIQIPAIERIPVIVYTDRPEILQPLVSTNIGTDAAAAQFRRTADYRPADSGLVVLDRFAPPVPPRANAIYIDPPRLNSPLPIVRAVLKPAHFAWIGGNVLGQGLGERELRLESASVFRASPGDIRVAEVNEGAVIVARAGPPKQVLVGFDPASAGARFELSTPLVFANILRWMDPDIFRQMERSVQPAGAIPIPVDESPEAIDVRRADGEPVPFSVANRTLRLFAASPETVRVSAGGRTNEYALELPEVGTSHWTPPAGARRGLPAGRENPLPRMELWPWLAGLGLACLVAEWLIFARPRRPAIRPINQRADLRRAS